MIPVLLEQLASLVIEEQQVFEVLKVPEVQMDNQDSRVNKEQRAYKDFPDLLDYRGVPDSLVRPVHRVVLASLELLGHKDLLDLLEL